MNKHLLNWTGVLAIMVWVGSAAPASAKIIFLPMLDASLSLNTARYNARYSAPRLDAQGNTLPTDSYSSGNNAYVYLAPNLGLTELPGLWLTPVFELEYMGANNILNLEDEAFLYNQRLDLYYVLGANYDLSKNWRCKLKAFGRTEKTRSAANETLDQGLYNYNDAGGWGEIGASYHLGVPMRTMFGYKGYTRRYPYYLPLTGQSSQLADSELSQSLQQALPADTQMKSYNVGEVWLRQEFTWTPFPLLTNLEVRFKDVPYTQMPVVQIDGTFGTEKRRDQYADLSLELPCLINDNHQIEIDYAHRLRISNQNYYDSSLGLPLGGYYNYFQNSARLLYTFKFGFTIAGFPPQGSAGVTWQRRQYLSRPSRQSSDTNDVYNFDNPHWEQGLEFAVTLKQQLFAKWFNVFLSYHGVTQTSNSSVEDGASYNYSYNTFTLGTAISY
ncbi:MAG: hypothetical protein AB1439_04650 [candidate division FCPU426 bacterium]